MPTVKNVPAEISDYVDVDIEIDDFLSACDSEDYKYIITCLIEDEWLTKNSLLETSKTTEIDNYLIKIFESQIQLTLDEEEILKKIASRLV